MKSDFQTGRWRVEPELNHVIVGDKTVHLEPKVMQVLVCLADRAGDVVSKEDLFRAVWPDTFVTDDVLTRAISELRKALDDTSRPPRFIQTIPKRGYRLLAPVERPSNPQPIRSLAVLPFANLNSDPDLDKAYDERSNWLIEMCEDPIFDSLRSDPRFDVLVARVGLPPARGESRGAVQLEIPAARVPALR